MGARSRDRDHQQADDGDARETDRESGHGAGGPRAPACETGKGRVVGKGPFEVLLVAPEGHQIRRAAEELDYVGRELASQSRFLRPEPALACPGDR